MFLAQNRQFSPLFWLLTILPKRMIGRLCGALFEIPLPRPLNSMLVRGYARLVGADIRSAAKPCREYASLSEFFTRDLKPGLRPVAQGPGILCSPADSLLRHVGEVREGLLYQTKGWRYSVRELLGVDDGSAWEGGFEFNFYLSPRDYHHVHSPIDGVITRAAYIPGSFWPVNSWSLARVRNLFARNERLVIYLKRKEREIALIMVGALNVGHLAASFDPALRQPCGPAMVRKYDDPISVKAGERIGTFKMGSSIIMLLPPGELTRCMASEGKPVLFGEGLGELR